MASLWQTPHAWTLILTRFGHTVQSQLSRNSPRPCAGLCDARRSEFNPWIHRALEHLLLHGLLNLRFIFGLDLCIGFHFQLMRVDGKIHRLSAGVYDLAG